MNRLVVQIEHAQSPQPSMKLLHSKISQETNGGHIERFDERGTNRRRPAMNSIKIVRREVTDSGGYIFEKGVWRDFAILDRCKWQKSWRTSNAPLNGSIGNSSAQFIGKPEPVTVIGMHGLLEPMGNGWLSFGLGMRVRKVDQD